MPPKLHFQLHLECGLPAPPEGSVFHISSPNETFLRPDLLPGGARLSPVTAGGAVTPRLGWAALGLGTGNYPFCCKYVNQAPNGGQVSPGVESLANWNLASRTSTKTKQVKSFSLL